MGILNAIVGRQPLNGGPMMHPGFVMPTAPAPFWDPKAQAPQHSNGSDPVGGGGMFGNIGQGDIRDFMSSHGIGNFGGGPDPTRRGVDLHGDHTGLGGGGLPGVGMVPPKAAGAIPGRGGVMGNIMSAFNAGGGGGLDAAKLMSMLGI